MMIYMTPATTKLQILQPTLVGFSWKKLRQSMFLFGKRLQLGTIQFFYFLNFTQENFEIMMNFKDDSKRMKKQMVSMYRSWNLILTHFRKKFLNPELSMITNMKI